MFRLRCRCACHAKRLSCILTVTLLFGLLSTEMIGQEARPRKGLTATGVIDTELLRSIEQRVLPDCLVDGPAQHVELPDYYWAENRDLRNRLEQIHQLHASDTDQSARAVTLVAGAAGVGKTFFKSKVFRKEYSADVVCRFDLRELYTEWMQDGTVVMKPDLYAGGIVINSLPALADPADPRLTEYLASQDAAFYVIDSLDEIHPDDYDSVLHQIERFVLGNGRRVVHAVVFGRCLAFLNYWQKYGKGDSLAEPESIALFVLQPPRFRTTGDLLVSSWNYHRYRYKLAWSETETDSQPMPLDVYSRWVESGFSRRGPFANIHFEPSESLRSDVHDTLVEWSQNHRIVGSMLYNLAGNSILRGIVEDHVLRREPYCERDVMREYLHALLRRDTQSDNRPSDASPQFLDLYLQLLEATAVRYAGQAKLDQRGYFQVHPEDEIQVRYAGQTLTFAVRRILNRSGVKHIDLLAPDGPRYGFEPIWFHRLLVEMHNDRLENSNQAVSLGTLLGPESAWSDGN